MGENRIKNFEQILNSKRINKKMNEFMGGCKIILIFDGLDEVPNKTEIMK
jgi:hypothetical protein